MSTSVCDGCGRSRSRQTEIPAAPYARPETVPVCTGDQCGAHLRPEPASRPLRTGHRRRFPASAHDCLRLAGTHHLIWARPAVTPCAIPVKATGPARLGRALATVLGVPVEQVSVIDDPRRVYGLVPGDLLIVTNSEHRSSDQGFQIVRGGPIVLDDLSAAVTHRVLSQILGESAGFWKGRPGRSAWRCPAVSVAHSVGVEDG